MRSAVVGSSACAKSGPLIGAPGARCIFEMFARTSGARPALRATSPAVARSVNASTPIIVRVTSGRSCSMAPSMDATTAVVSRRAAILFWSIKASDSRRIVTIVEAPKPRMSTITMSSPILIASRERNIAERSALRGLRDRLRELVRLFRIERPEAREHLSRLREPAHLHVRLAEVLERLRVLRAESQRFLVGLHGFLELPPLPHRVAEPVPRLWERGPDLGRLAVGLLGSRPVALAREGLALVEV